MPLSVPGLCCLATLVPQSCISCSPAPPWCLHNSSDFLLRLQVRFFFSPGILGRSFLESCHRESRNIGLILCWKWNCTYLLTFSRPSHSCFGLLLFEALLMFQVMQSSPYQINSLQISVYWWQMSPNFDQRSTTSYTFQVSCCFIVCTDLSAAYSEWKYFLSWGCSSGLVIIKAGRSRFLLTNVFPRGVKISIFYVLAVN